MQSEETTQSKKANRRKLLTTLGVLIVVLGTVGITVLFALRGGRNQEPVVEATATTRQPIPTATPLTRATATEKTLPDTPTTVAVENTASPTATAETENTAEATDTATAAPTDTPLVIVVTATFTPHPNVTCGAPAGWTIYTVQRYDTLYSISVRTGTTVNQLKTANCLTSDAIYVGQRLYVPYYPVSTNTPLPPTLTPTITPTVSITATATLTPTVTPTGLPTELPTNTPIPPTSIPPTVISPIATPTPTNTPIPPTPTSTVAPTSVSPIPTPTP